MRSELLNGLESVCRLRHDPHVGLPIDDQADSFKHEAVVVNAQDRQELLGRDAGSGIRHGFPN